MRYHSLDVVRGYAALTVVIAHTTAIGIYNNPHIWPYLVWSPLRFLWAGHQAVIVFFVLSGFALSKMIESAPSFKFTRYVLARAARLYFPFIFSLAFVFITQHLVMHFGYEWNKGWMGVAKPVFDRDQIINHITMIGFYNYFEINPPAWSLVYEARISVIFPFIYLLVKRFDLKAIAILLFVDVVSIFMMHKNPELYGVDPLSSTLLTIHYSFFFALGALIAKKIDLIKEFEASLSQKGCLTLFFIGLMLYSYPFNNPWTLAQRGMGDIATSLGAAIIIASSLRISRGLFFNIGVYLGKISFSLYLAHYTILSLAIILFVKTGEALVWAITIPASIAFAHLFTKLIDIPSIQLSRYIYRK